MSPEFFPTDTLDEEDDGAAVQNRAVLLQAYGLCELHPRQVDILHNRSMPALPALCNLVLLCISQGLPREVTPIPLHHGARPLCKLQW